ncbi:hypothetical protein HHL16_13535 [Pseudoflavitalea sp. G-6-1-2]|uniref:hypothetical protein n=1 Tax=Pseudoflavitalea sp. G-6-1-2 TaxID=2728841 RepID=UPI00146C4A72|nr:hypothetical protein [Pseudoflavitalea sp. G-6-1-2]NML21906.1 hypothetical protein [Pseudoflavitalea sp. G-6-1-2]
MNIRYMKAGYCFASGFAEDSTASDDAKLSANYPCGINNRVPFPMKKVSLEIFRPWYGSAPNLMLSNGIDETISFRTTDSRLPIIAEAWVDEAWQPIEYMPQHIDSHQVIVDLAPLHYWSFNIPGYRGDITTKIRYKLSLSDGTFVYSNELWCGINKEQLSVKEETLPDQLRVENLSDESLPEAIPAEVWLSAVGKSSDDVELKAIFQSLNIWDNYLMQMPIRAAHQRYWPVAGGSLHLEFIDASAFKESYRKVPGKVSWVLHAVIFHNEVRTYAGELPFRLQFSDSRKNVREKLKQQGDYREEKDWNADSWNLPGNKQLFVFYKNKKVFKIDVVFTKK